MRREAIRRPEARATGIYRVLGRECFDRAMMARGSAVTATTECGPEQIEALIRRSVREETAGLIDGLQRFVDRRIAELSMEVSASVQLMDYSESNLSGQMARIHEQIARVVAAPSREARNSGVELEAIVQVTETAANRIMEAAEAIDDWVRQGRRDADGMASVTERIGAIFEACSFQDLTSQRVRRAIEHLEKVEAMLGTAATPADLPPDAGPTAEPQPAGLAGPDLAQDAIDRLLAG